MGTIPASAKNNRELKKKGGKRGKGKKLPK